MDSSVNDRSIRRVVLASFVGTTIEWYDFFLYGTAAAVIFPQVFFPESEAMAGTMKSFATFAVGFFARPVGGVVFGHFGDRIGRKSMLVTTLILMGVATFLVGILPTHAQVGIWAPILLVFLRFVQGFGVGGEWGGAVLMTVEHGHEGKRGFYASWVQAGVPVGLLLANLAFWTFSERLDEAAFLSWGWRVPFLLGGLLLAVGMFIRLQIMESPIFEQMLTEKKSEEKSNPPIIEVLKTHPREVLLAMGARFAENSCFYIFTIYSLSYATKYLGLERNTLFQGVLIASVFQMIVIPMFGHLSDKVGRRPVYLGGAITVLVFSWIFFPMLGTKETMIIWLAMVLGLIAHSAMYAPQAAFFSEMFGTGVRYTGASLGYQMASPLAGGLAPLIATWLLVKSGGDPWPVAAYLSVMCLITIVSVWLAKETHREEL